MYEKSFESLVDIIQSAQNKDVVVIGILFPQNPDYQNTGAYGRYGLRRSVAEQFVSRFQELEKSYSNFKFIDRNRMGNHGYPSEWFVDDDHLCIEGAKSFTATVDLILNGLE